MKEYLGYKVSEDGRVFNRRNGKELSQQINVGRNTSKYLRVTLQIDGKRKHFFVHRIVAELYVPNPDNKAQVNHIDGDSFNNDYRNLEWVTQSENMKHSYDVCGRKPSNRVLSDDAILDIYCNLSSKEAVEKYGISRYTYYDVKNLRRKIYRQVLGIDI